VEAEIASLNVALADLVPKLGRLHLAKADFTRALRQAELAWVSALIDDIKRGDLTWKPNEFFPRPQSVPEKQT
jgi:hypothetical protein